MLSIGFITHFLLITSVFQTTTPPTSCTCDSFYGTYTQKEIDPPTLFPIHLHHPGTHQRFLSNLTFSKLFDSDLQVSSTPLSPPQLSYNYNHNPFLIPPSRHVILPFSSYTEFFPTHLFVLKIIHRSPALSGAIFLGFLTGGSFGKLTKASPPLTF